eukprot:scaffold126014_cov35-Tisochrysis_lutea.AAC.4
MKKRKARCAGSHSASATEAEGVVWPHSRVVLPDEGVDRHVARVEHHLALVGELDARVEGEIVCDGVSAALAQAGDQQRGPAQRVRPVPNAVARFHRRRPPTARREPRPTPHARHASRPTRRPDRQRIL